MFRRCLALLGIVSAGCAMEPAQPVESDHGVQEQTCAAVVAAHVGKGVDAVSATWTGETAEGLNVVAVSDRQGVAGERVHTCEIDGAGQVQAILHTGA